MIKVITDSTANLPPQILEEFPSITVIPSYVTFQNTTLRESVDLTAAEFYRRLAVEKELPTTNQATVEDFKAAYSQILSDSPGATIISIHISGALSGMWGSARQAAAQFPDADIHVFDSRSLSMGHGLMVRQAAFLAQAGLSAQDILAQLETMKSHVQLYYALDTLDYLFKGGRIGIAARIIGTALDTKPILTIKNGTVAPYENHRSLSRAVEAIRDKVISEAQDKHGLHLSVMHAVCKDEAEKLAAEIQAKVIPHVMLIGEIGPAIGVYAGPGTLGACWWIPEQ
ncbi:MAG: DegV family protein [Anaerolineae bacterium]|nr:DegV family protein [Anaerolineae bacterium]